ncbi:MAG: methyltransferase [bacterium]
MEPFRYHVFICQADKPEWVPSCPGKGGKEVLAALRREIENKGLSDGVLVTECGCLGICERGPNLIVYPDASWYAGVTAEDVPALVEEHLVKGEPVQRLLLTDPKKVKQEIKEHDQKTRAVKKAMEEGGVMPPEFNELMRSFMQSRAVLTAIELDLMSAVGDGATASEAASAIGADVRSTESLLNALVALEMLEKENDTFYNSELTGKFLRSDSSLNSRDGALHAAHLWHRWSTLTDAVKAGTAVHPEAKAKRSQEQTRAFIAAMHRNASFQAGLVASKLDLAGVKRVLDLGGGSGAYSIALAQKNSELKATVFDVPEVIELTRSYIEEANMKGRILVRAGDMMEDELGMGYDLVLLFAICHMWSPEENQKLFQKIFEALNPGGMLAMQDFVLSEDKTAPRFGALFALNMLVNTPAGGAYSEKEYADWFRAAGFNEPETILLPGPSDLMTARKPE